jgi:putative spermidine/putrescine transport system ATP-binding protein
VAEFIGVTNSFAGTVADGSVVLPAGARLPARVVAAQPAGSAVRVLVRPGDLQVRTDGGGHLSGTVLTHSFLGPVTRLSVRLPSGEVVRVDVPSERASATPTGSGVELAVDPGAAMLAG